MTKVGFAAAAALLLSACASTGGYEATSRGAAMQAGDAVTIAQGSNQCLDGALTVSENSRATAVGQAAFNGGDRTAVADARSVDSFFQTAARGNAVVCGRATGVAVVLMDRAEDLAGVQRPPQ